jgi:hypothetical protein
MALAELSVLTAQSKWRAAFMCATKIVWMPGCSVVRSVEPKEADPVQRPVLYRA